MADYIRRDIVLKIINTVNDTGGFAGYADYCTLFDEIDTMPASDVQPVKHGRWENPVSVGNGIMFCSVCRNEAYWDTDYGQQLFDYCPYCGARMDGEQNETIKRAYTRAAAIIEQITAEDVQPVKHGKWISLEYDTYFECSVCKNIEDIESNYCPRCGAYMQG